MSYGLSDKNLTQFTDVFRQHREVVCVTLFWSRAKGTHRTGSDIDLALTGINFSLDTLLAISIQLEVLGTLYSFDVVDVDRLKNKALIDHICRVGVVIYRADGQP